MERKRGVKGLVYGFGVEWLFGWKDFRGRVLFFLALLFS